MMIQHWTVKGSQQLENQIDQMILDLRSRLSHAFGPHEYKNVVISGGYGRGEGGVEWIQGQEVLHNNLDLIWVAPAGASLEQIRTKLQAESLYFEEHYQVVLDTFVIAENRLKHLPCLVMLYDMREGHRVILGKEGYLQGLIPYQSQDILPSDIRNLLINRGALLLINRWILSQGICSQALRKQIIRHAMKAIVGMGDALLFMLGQYHWSYQVKARRMAQCFELPLAVRKLYQQAIDFRFSPDYSQWEDINLIAWNEMLLAEFQKSHQAFESWRLGVPSAQFVWSAYIERALKSQWQSEWHYRGVALRKFKNLVLNQNVSQGLSISANLGLRCTDSASLLAIIFPFVAYQASSQNDLNWIARQLQLEPEQLSESLLLDSYLKTWGAYLDPALLPKLKQWKHQAQVLEMAL